MSKIVYHINSVILTFLIIPILLSCQSQQIGEYQTSPQGVVSIAHLRSLLKGYTQTIHDDISIEGYVIANDLYNEYRHEVVISDQNCGISLAVDLDHTSKTFPIGAFIRIHCSGLQIAYTSGRTILGKESEQGYRVERLSSSDIARHISIAKEKAQAIEPAHIEISDITTSLEGKFIRIDKIEFVDAGKRWCEKDPATGLYLQTIRYAVDSFGNDVGIIIDPKCDYHSEEIPSGSGTICGIVEIADNHPVIRIVQHLIIFHK